jgi:hypothetical protein
MQTEIQTIEARSRQERESKKKEVRHLLEDLYRMEPNTVGKIIDTFFEHDFLPNWYFHSNRTEDVASDLFIVSSSSPPRTSTSRTPTSMAKRSPIS